jgi:hypothetical protein
MFMSPAAFFQGRPGLCRLAPRWRAAQGSKTKHRATYRETSDMMKFIPILTAAGIMLAGVTLQAQAMPAAPIAKAQTSNITQVRDGCGHHRYRGPHGHCHWDH